MTTETPVATPDTPEVSEAPPAPAQDTAAPAPQPAVTGEVVEKDKEPKVLDLTAIAPNRRLVKLPTVEHPEGENFELRLLDDFGIAMQQKLLQWSRTYERLFNSDEDEGLTEDQQVRLKFVLDSLFDIVLDAPKAIKEKMSDGVRSRVVTAFSLAPLIAQSERAAEAEKKAEEEAKAKEEAATGTSTSES